ncbi:hypothetical protein V1264_004555 [Littorina saxatilis]|uniref:Uncharacterized protein n=1 Tax=Littorina saxatilis TaxID=31220 RepID=A0AAN9G7A5_9CAEN
MPLDLKADTTLTEEKKFPEPFDFGRSEKVFPPDTLGPDVSEKDERDLNLDASLLHQFANETSAHGCAHVVSTSRGTFTRVVWALSVTGMLGAMVYTLFSMLQAYDQYPVNTLTKVTVKEELPFPGVTLCNLNEVDVSKIAIDNTTFRDIKTEFVFDFTLTNASDPEVRRALDTPIDAVVNASWIGNKEFLMGCFINSVRLNCSGIFNFVQNSRTKCASLDTEHSSLKSMRYGGPKSGIRVILNVHQEGYAISDSVAAGVKLFVHEPGHRPDLQSSGILLSPGVSTYVGTRPLQYTFLPKPYKAYGDEACVDINDPSDPEYPGQLRLTDQYSYAACNLECTLDAVEEKCKCKGVLNSENSSYPMCTVEQFYGCYDKELSLLYFNVTADNRCGCPRPCQHTEYQTDISSAFFPSDESTLRLQSAKFLPATGVSIRENYMEVRVYLDKLVLQEIVHEPVYTFSSVMGTIGGQMGFFLGASVLTVAELAELCFWFLFGFLRRMSTSKKLRKAKNRRIIPVKPKTSGSAAS